MSRTLTSAAQTEANKNTGAYFRRILEVQYTAGTVYYSDEVLTSPVTTQGRVMDWGQLQLDAEPGKVGGHGQVTIKLADTDHAIKALMDTEPGIQDVPVFLHLYFVGTTWATDKVTLFGGIMTAPMSWDEQSAVWSITLKGIENRYDRDIGVPLSRQVFTEIVCADCEGENIPIVYGNPCRRVPACIVDKPTGAALNATLHVTDTTMTINRTADEAGFTSGSTISLIVGDAGRWERITGSFASGSSTTFNITSRGAILAEGVTDGYAAEGMQYIAIPKSDLPDYDANDPSTPASRSGYPIYIKNQTGNWITTMVTYWQHQGQSIVVTQRSGISTQVHNQYKLGSAPGSVPIWPVGTPVHGSVSWKYVVNLLPSKEVVRVEARGKINLPNGDSTTRWMTYDSSRYTVNLNDKTYNTDLGRDAGDPGITTITMDTSPTEAGFDSETIWVTLKGITDDNTETGTVLSNPADIIENLLTNEFLGNLGASAVDSASFATAKSAITTVMAFALLENKRLNELTSDLAFQAGCVLVWDGGKAYLNKISNTLASSDNELTIVPAKYSKQSLKIQERAVSDLVTEITAKFRQTVPGEEIKLVRSSTEAEGYYGKRTQEINLWAYQAPTSVAIATEFWLQNNLHRNRTVTVDCYLHALHLQPADTVILDVDDGSGNAVFDSVPARVKSIRHTAANANTSTMEKIQLDCEMPLYSFAIETSTPSDVDCDAPVSQPEFLTVVAGASSGAPPDMVGTGDQTIPLLSRQAPDPAFTSGASSETSVGSSAASSSAAVTSAGSSSAEVTSAGSSSAGSSAGGSSNSCINDTFTDTNGTAIASHTMDNGTGWTKSGGGTATIQDNTLELVMSGPPLPLVLTDVADGDGTLTTKIYFDSSSDATTRLAYVYFRYSDSNNYWRVNLNAGTNVITLNRYESGSNTQVDSASLTLNDDTWYTVTATLNGSSVSVTIGAETLSDTSSFNATATNAGLAIFGSGGTNTVNFDDFQFCASGGSSSSSAGSSSGGAGSSAASSSAAGSSGAGAGSSSGSYGGCNMAAYGTLAAWYEPGGIQTSGSNVTSWIPVTGDTLTARSGQEPSTDTIGGYDAANFSAAGDGDAVVNASSDYLGGSTEFTIATVFNLDTLDSTQTLFYQADSPTTPRLRITANASGALTLTMVQTTGTQDFVSSAAGAVTTGTDYVLVCRVNLTSDTAEIWVNGVKVANQTSLNSASLENGGGNDGFAIGSTTADPPNAEFKGAVAELVFWSEALSNTDLNDAESCLLAKYSISGTSS